MLELTIQLRDAWARFIAQQLQPDLFVTLTYGREYSAASVDDDMRELSRRVNKAMFAKSKNKHVRFVYVKEFHKGTEQYHVHAIFEAPPAHGKRTALDQRNLLEKYIPNTWISLNRTPNIETGIKTIPVYSEYDAADYMLKNCEQRKHRNFDFVMLDFLQNQKG
ncbi:MAG: hypothetical protein H6998_00070 [Hahellaceae bacterium]|nr:hypothetical protein [Hahellaceae bacterium]